MVGNQQKMREALIEIEKMAHCDLGNVYPKYRNKFDNLVGGIERIARAALAAPPRQCDVGTSEEQVRRFSAFCDLSKSCKSCPVYRPNFTAIECFAKWAQTPYESKEGGKGDGV